MVYYGHRYYIAELGRWNRKDLIGERGGINLYAFVNNDSINIYDPLGLDFIAVGIRPAKAILGMANHMSIEYYEEKPACTKKGYRFTMWEVGVYALKNAKKSSYFELIPTFNEYERLYSVSSKKKNIKIIQVRTAVGISFIEKTSTATKHFVIYDDTNKDAKEQWAKIVFQATHYDYAEQPPHGRSLKNWPNSKYQLPPGNNSNTFVHEMAKVIGASADVFPLTPGATEARGVKDNGPIPTPK